MEEYKDNIIKKITSRIKELDGKIRISVYDDSITLIKLYDDDNFFTTNMLISEILKWEYVFGVEMVSKDLVDSVNVNIND